MVRLTFNQIAASIRSIFGNAEADAIAQTYEIGDLTHRTFPPLANPREGSSITDANWQSGDHIANDLGDYVFENFATVTGCTATPTDACARAYVARLAEEAYRRPLTTEETMRLMDGVYTPIAPGGGTDTEMTIQEAVRYSVYAIFESPQFLYRTEFGDAAANAGGLQPYEVASQLSFFLADGPPDQPLLDAAAAGNVNVASQVDRLLATDPVKTNLAAAMFAYFTLPVLEVVNIDPMKTPAWTEGLRASMYHEAELFLQDNLWSGPLDGLLTSRETVVNSNIATLYGVQFPPAGVTPDADGFAPIQLPADRAGLLTLSGFLTEKSNPDAESVVRRGLLVNGTILCGDNPPFPDDQATLDKIAAAAAVLMDASERERADYRATTPPCNGCHTGFDPYGLSLENYDLVGRYRTMDEQGRPIDATTTLPENAGSVMVTSPVEMANALVASGAFGTCLASNLLAYALAEIPPTADTSLATTGCATGAVATGFNASGTKSFSDLARSIALSNTLMTRSAGVNQ